jgi:hypothetical protein
MHHRQPAQKTKLPDRHVRRAHGWRKEEERRRKKSKEEEVVSTLDGRVPCTEHNGTTMEPQ